MSGYTTRSAFKTKPRNFKPSIQTCSSKHSPSKTQRHVETNTIQAPQTAAVARATRNHWQHDAYADQSIRSRVSQVNGEKVALSTMPNNSHKLRLSVSEMQKILSGETPIDRSRPVRYLSIEDQIRLGIPTDSVSISFNPLRKR